MFQREEILKILSQAQKIDKKFEMFGSSTHKYKLNLPIQASFVRSIEEKYGFTLPEDYFHFITEVGDGGAGPDYGIQSFTEFLSEGSSPGVEKFFEAYRYSLAKPFVPRPMVSEELEEFSFARQAYEENPGHFFVYEKEDENELCDTDGYLTLGTHGCQWDFGLIITGDRRGQVFDYDNEGAFRFVANSFTEFYKNWLNRIADAEGFRRELEARRELRKRIRSIK